MVVELGVGLQPVESTCRTHSLTSTLLSRPVVGEPAVHRWERSGDQTGVLSSHDRGRFGFEHRIDPLSPRPSSDFPNVTWLTLPPRNWDHRSTVS